MKKSSLGDPHEPVTSVLLEMAVALAHLSRSRKNNNDLLERLDRVEEPINNRLVNLKRLPTEYSHQRWMDRDKIRGGLMHTKTRLEGHRHSLLTNYERDVQGLHNKLVALWTAHQQLQDHGNRQTTEET